MTNKNSADSQYCVGIKLHIIYTLYLIKTCTFDRGNAVIATLKNKKYMNVQITFQQMSDSEICNKTRTFNIYPVYRQVFNARHPESGYNLNWPVLQRPESSRTSSRSTLHPSPRWRSWGCWQLYEGFRLVAPGYPFPVGETSFSHQIYIERHASCRLLSRQSRGGGTPQTHTKQLITVINSAIMKAGALQYQPLLP